MAEIKKYVSYDKLGKYDAKIKSVITAGDEATLAAAQSYAEGLAPNYDAAGSAATVQGKLDDEVARAQAAEAAALKAGQDAQADVDALETYIGTIPETATATDVVSYIEEKTAGIATDAALEGLTNRVTQAENDIDAIEADYLKKADKDELSAAITAEETRAKGVESGLETRLKAVEDDYLTSTDKATLEGSIGTAQAAAEAAQADIDAFMKATEVGDAVVDTLKEIQDYITTDGAAADEMTKNIGANADAIDALEGRMNTAEGAIDALEEADAAQDEKIAALEAKFGEGEGSVADQIADAVAAEAELRVSGDEAATAKAQQGIDDAAAALEAAQAADAKAVSLNEAMDGRVAAVEAKAHEHANKALLDTYTQTEADLADAVAKKHEHANKTVLDGITAAQITAWDAAEANAKAHAESLNSTLEAKVNANTEAINAFVEVSEEEINALFA